MAFLISLEQGIIARDREIAFLSFYFFEAEPPKKMIDFYVRARKKLLSFVYGLDKIDQDSEFFLEMESWTEIVPKIFTNPAKIKRVLVTLREKGRLAIGKSVKLNSASSFITSGNFILEVCFNEEFGMIKMGVETKKKDEKGRGKEEKNEKEKEKPLPKEKKSLKQKNMVLRNHIEMMKFENAILEQETEKIFEEFNTLLPSYQYLLWQMHAIRLDLHSGEETEEGPEREALERILGLVEKFKVKNKLSFKYNREFQENLEAYQKSKGMAQKPEEKENQIEERNYEVRRPEAQEVASNVTKSSRRPIITE